MLSEEMKKYHRDWYHAHKSEIGPRKRLRQAKQYRFLRHIASEIKLFFGCSVCGFNGHPRALEFHHRDPSEKDFSIGETYSGASVIKMLFEISKCDVLCANCHAIHHE